MGHSLPLPDRSDNIMAVNPKVRTSKNRIQIRCTYPKGTPRAICLPLESSPVNLVIAEGIAAQIKLDILQNNFDFTHQKYKAIAKPDSFLETENTQTEWKYNLVDIWEQYAHWKVVSKAWEESTAKNYNNYLKRINKLPLNLNPFDNPLKVQEYFLSLYSAETTRRTMVQINAACNWAANKNRALIPHNPFADLDKIKETKGTRNRTCKPFSKDDVKAILEAFLNDTYCNPSSGFKHNRYTDYVEFMFLTGTRPEEACEIRKKDIRENHIVIERAFRIDTGTLKGTKTKESRKFPLNLQLRAIVARQNHLLKDKESFLFPGAYGDRFDYHNFTGGPWKKVIDGLYFDNKISQQLPPYNCKHTFISHCIDAGLSPTQISSLNPCCFNAWRTQGFKSF